MDTVEVLFSKIPPELLAQRVDNTISRKIISKTRECLRILNTKSKVGDLGRGDSAEARSAVLLEIILRKGVQLEDGSTSESVRVPLELLGKKAASSKRDITNLAVQVKNVLERTNLNIGTQNTSNQSAISNRRNGPPSSRSRIAPVPKSRVNTHKLYARRILKEIGKGSSGKLNSAISNTVTSTTPVNRRKHGIHTTNVSQECSNTSWVDPSQQQQQQQQRQDYIRNLSIKLQSFLHDPSNVEKKAKNLLKNIIRFRLCAKGRNKDILNDVESNLIYYQGVCFYLTVRDLEQGDTVNNDDDIEGNDEDNYLSKDDIIHELRIDDETFSKIFDSVSSSVRKMGKRKYTDDEPQSKQHTQNTTKKRSRTSSNENQSTSSTSKKSAADDFLATLFMSSTSADSLGEHGNGLLTGNTNTDYLDGDNKTINVDKIPTSGKPKYVNEEKFIKWKNEILLKTLGSASTPIEKFEATRDDARRILDKYKNKQK